MLLCHSWPWSGSVSPVLVTISTKEIRSRNRCKPQCSVQRYAALKKSAVYDWNNQFKNGLSVTMKSRSQNCNRSRRFHPPIPWQPRCVGPPVIYTFYVEVMKCLRDAIQLESRQSGETIGSCTVTMHIILPFQCSSWWRTKFQLPATVFPDLTLCDFWLFPQITLIVNHFASAEEIQQKAMENLSAISKEGFQACFQQLQDCCSRFVRAEGQYFKSD